MKVVVRTHSGEEIKKEEFGIGYDCRFRSVHEALCFLRQRYGENTYRDEKQIYWDIDDKTDVFATFEDNNALRVGDKVRSNNNFSTYRFENGKIIDSYWLWYHRYYRVQLPDGLVKDFRTCDLLRNF